MIKTTPLNINKPAIKKLNPIKEELRPLINEFLSSDFYMKEFNELTRLKKFKSKADRRLYLLERRGTEIGFRFPELNILFTRWQLYKQLKDKPGYSDILNGPLDKAKELLDLVQPLPGINK